MEAIEAMETIEDILLIPDYFRDKVIRVFGEKGKDWLNKLPELLETFIYRWELTECRIEEHLSIHYICYARSPKYGEVVMKTGVPHLELISGIDALLQYGGKDACRLYEADREQGVMLMERILPGTRLRDVFDFNQRLQVGTYLVENLPQIARGQHSFPIYKTQLDKAIERTRREKRAGEEFIAMLDYADDFYKEILSLDLPKVLLHGDLHHENILMDASGNWKIIDPQGRIGEKFLEVGRFLLNEWDWFGGTGNLKHMTQCIDSFAEALGESRKTIAISCFLDYALSSCWTLEEEGSGPEDVKTPTQQLKALLEIIKACGA